MSRPLHLRRGHPFDPRDYPEHTRLLLEQKLRPLPELVAALPRRFSFFSALALSAPRGFLRALSTRDDYEEVTYYCALSVEPYAFLRDPRVTITNAYLSPLDRLIAQRMGKTVAHLPRQFVQFCDTLKQPGKLDYFLLSATPPDRDGFVSLGVNCEVIPEAIAHYRKLGRPRIIVELNSHLPWVEGHRLHLSQVDAAYSFCEPLPQLPAPGASEADRQIADHAARYVQDGDTIQLGIGAIPALIAERLRERRGLKIHSELLGDAIVDLVRAGAVDSRGKATHDGLIVGTFALGTDKLYDWLHRNPEVALLPIRETNDPCAIARNRRMKSLNAALMVDLHGQISSDAVGFKQVSGVGGQLEFVMGSQLSEGGQSVICLRSTSRVRGRLVSNIVLALPRGTPVTVPRQYADVIVTEHGVAEIRHADALERARALCAIAHPAFRPELERQACAAGLWERREGFDSFAKRALYGNLPYVLKLRRALAKGDLRSRPALLWNELRRLLADPDLPTRLRRFYQENRR